MESHVLILTDEDVLIYVKYSYKITHLAVFNDYKGLGIIVKDCFIDYESDAKIFGLIAKAVIKWVFKYYNESIDPITLVVNKHERNNQSVVMSISGKTDGGQPFSVTPSSLLSSQKNFFSEFY